MAKILLEDSSGFLVSENVAGITGASELNDTITYVLVKEVFETSPALRGWQIGTDWAWNPTNQNMEPV